MPCPPRINLQCNVMTRSAHSARRNLGLISQCQYACTHMNFPVRSKLVLRCQICTASVDFQGVRTEAMQFRYLHYTQVYTCIACPNCAVVDFQRIWTDGGALTGGEGISIWRPVAPPGYAALGEWHCNERVFCFHVGFSGVAFWRGSASATLLRAQDMQHAISAPRRLLC